jgi:hypothetical protein
MRKGTATDVFTRQIRAVDVAMTVPEVRLLVAAWEVVHREHFANAGRGFTRTGVVTQILFPLRRVIAAAIEQAEARGEIEKVDLLTGDFEQFAGVLAAWREATAPHVGRDERLGTGSFVQTDTPPPATPAQGSTT